MCVLCVIFATFLYLDCTVKCNSSIFSSQLLVLSTVPRGSVLFVVVDVWLVIYCTCSSMPTHSSLFIHHSFPSFPSSPSPMVIPSIAVGVRASSTPAPSPKRPSPPSPNASTRPSAVVTRE